MTVELISALFGTILSLLFEFVPGFKTWYEKLTKVQKRLTMVAIIAAIVAGAFILGCANLIYYFTCDVAGAWKAVAAFIAAVVANQTTHLVLKKDNS